MARKGKLAEENGESRDPLKRLTDIAALLLVKGEGQEEKIETLAAVGYTPAEIAALIGSTPNTVSVTLYQARKKKKKKR